MARLATNEPRCGASGKLSTYLMLPALDVQQRYTIPEAALYLRQSVAKLYNDIAAGRLTVMKAGARTYVHGSEIARVSAEPIAA